MWRWSNELETVTLSSSASSIDFTGISQDYRHLAIKIVTKAVSNEESGLLRFNNDNASNYTWQFANGYGTGTNAQYNSESGITNGYYDNDTFNSTLIEVYDYTSTDKYTTILHRGGAAGGGIRFGAGTWNNTAAVTQVNIRANSATSLAAGVVVSLYGIG